MNLHPIIVHFPIALLSLYCVLEMCRFRKFLENKSFFYIKLFLLFFGTIGTFFALQTGGIAKRAIINELRALVHVHSNFAVFATWIFSILLLLYLIDWANKDFSESKFFLSAKTMTKYFEKIWIIKLRLASFVLNSDSIMFLIAVVGLVVITITGALGGAIVYGPNVDPLVQFIYNLFVKQ